MTKTLLKAVALGTIASMIFYCGAALQTGEPDALAQDAGLDGGTDGGACSVCPGPEQKVEVFDVSITQDGTRVIPLEGWPDKVIIQTYEYTGNPGYMHWVLVSGGGICGAKIFNSAPDYAPNIPVPSIYYHTGFDRWCKVVIRTVN